MKQHKNYLILACLCLGAAGLAACSSSNDGPDKPDNTPATGDGVKAGITTEVITRAEHVTAIPEGGKMNLFVYNQNDVKADNLLLQDASATLGASGWSMSPELYLNKTDHKLAYIVAAYPWQPSVASPLVYPVDMTQQNDVLYSGSLLSGLVSVNNPTARLQMKHALSMACFEIEKARYSGQGMVTEIAVEGEVVANTLTMDITTGKLTTLTTGGYSVPSSTQLGGEERPSVWVAPFSTKQQGAKLRMVIDGKTFTADFPDVSMVQGYQYGFHLILTNNGLVFRSDKIDEISLNDGLVDMGAAEGYGLLRITMAPAATAFEFPVFTGTDVFGTINTGDAATNYSLGGSVALGQGREILVETWNSTGFEISNLEGVEAIDLSKY